MTIADHIGLGLGLGLGLVTALGGPDLRNGGPSEWRTQTTKTTKWTTSKNWSTERLTVTAYAQNTLQFSRGQVVQPLAHACGRPCDYVQQTLTWIDVSRIFAARCSVYCNCYCSLDCDRLVVLYELNLKYLHDCVSEQHSLIQFLLPTHQSEAGIVFDGVCLFVRVLLYRPIQSGPEKCTKFRPNAPSFCNRLQ